MTEQLDENNFCAKCENPLESEAKFCADCGIQVQEKLQYSKQQQTTSALFEDIDYEQHKPFIKTTSEITFSCATTARIANNVTA